MFNNEEMTIVANEMWEEYLNKLSNRNKLDLYWYAQKHKEEIYKTPVDLSSLEEPAVVSSRTRYKMRIKKFTENEKNSVIAKAKHHFWWIVHNVIVHPAIGIIPCKWTFLAHDWTSQKLNYN